MGKYNHDLKPDGQGGYYSSPYVLPGDQDPYKPMPEVDGEYDPERAKAVEKGFREFTELYKKMGWQDDKN